MHNDRRPRNLPNQIKLPAEKADTSGMRSQSKIFLDFIYSFVQLSSIYKHGQDVGKRRQHTDTSSRMSSGNLSKLFAVPSQPLSPSFPLRLPGISEESGKALVETLKEDYVKYHVFFDTVGRHK
jgi:hypothetical protein